MGEQKRKARLTFFFVCGRLTTMTEEAKRGDCDDEKDESSYPGRGVVGWDGSTTSAEGEGMFSIKSQRPGGIPSEEDGEGEVWKGRVPQVCQIRMMRPSAARGSGQWGDSEALLW